MAAGRALVRATSGGCVVDGQRGHRVEVPLRAAESLIRRSGHFGRIGRAGGADDSVGVEVNDDGDDGVEPMSRAR